MNETDKEFVKRAVEVVNTEQELKGILYRYSLEEEGDCQMCQQHLYSMLLTEAGVR